MFPDQAQCTIKIEYILISPYGIFINATKRIRYRIEKEVLEPSWKTDRQHVEHLKQKNLEKESVS